LKSIGKTLTSVDGLAMEEVVGEFTGKKVGPMYFRGSKPIDAVWATADVQVAGACIMPADYGIGDHQLFVVDFVTALLIGLSPKKIVWPQARRLNCRIPGAVLEYNKRMEDKIYRHRLFERIGAIHNSQWGKERKRDLLDWIDKGGEDEKCDLGRGENGPHYPRGR
jgi:hypothetical protein